MITPPTAPSPGKPVSAGFFARLIGWVKSIQLVEGSGYRLRRGPNGTSLEIDARAVGSPAAAARPWAFSCAEDPDTHERVGGWTNCVLQVGYNKWLTSADVDMPGRGAGDVIGGTDRTDDGDYVVEVNVATRTATIMLRGEATHAYPLDRDANVVYVDIGSVEDGVQTSRIPNHPVVYRYE